MQPDDAMGGEVIPISNPAECLRPGRRPSVFSDLMLRGDEHSQIEAFEQAQELIGHKIGPRTHRDCNDVHGEVDFTYDETEPPIAVELSSIVEGSVLQGVREAERTAKRIELQPGAGKWVVWIRPKAKWNPLRNELPTLIQRGFRFRAGIGYSGEDLAEAAANGNIIEFVAECRRLGELGLVRLEQVAGTPDEVAVHPAQRGGPIGEFGADLATVIESNVAKLSRWLETHETHLMITVSAGWASAWPNQTAPPNLPPEIHVLWVYHLSGQAKGFVLWRANRGEAVWSFVGEKRAVEILESGRPWEAWD